VFSFLHPPLLEARQIVLLASKREGGREDGEEEEEEEEQLSLLAVRWDEGRQADVLVEVAFTPPTSSSSSSSSSSKPPSSSSSPSFTVTFTTLDENNNSNSSSSSTPPPPPPPRILKLQPWGGQQRDSALIETEEGKIYKYLFLPRGGGREGGRGREGRRVLGPVATLLEPCPWVAPLELHTGEEGEEREGEGGREGGRDPSLEYGGREGGRGVMVVGLSGRSRLYFGEHLICGAVASVLINHTFGFLLFLTLGTRPLLTFIPFRALARLDLMGGSEGGIAGMEGGGLEGGRAVERGARLVASLHSSPSVLLQLPRGNIEVVSPHPLVLQQAARLLDAKRYGQAFSVLRRNKLNLNFLIDYSPEKFEKEVREFVVPQMLMNDGREGAKARPAARNTQDQTTLPPPPPKPSSAPSCATAHPIASEQEEQAR